MTTAKIFSAAEVAESLETDARTLRRFLRSEASPVENVGKGKRYALDAKGVRAVKKAYEAWAATKGNKLTALKAG